MHPGSYALMSEFAQHVHKVNGEQPFKILDVGSASVNGCYRPLFTWAGVKYVGLDLAPGENVHYVPKNMYDWRELEDQSFDVIISGQVLEHVEFPWLTMEQICRKIKIGGLICVIAPSRGPEHRYPTDCYRYYPDGMRALAKWCGLKVLKVNYVLPGTSSDYGSETFGDCICVMTKEAVSAPVKRDMQHQAADPAATPPQVPGRQLRVDLGCGRHKMKGCLGVDIVPGPDVDVVADLTQRFPFADQSVAYLRAYDALEHWPDRLHTMNEIWRVCEHGAGVDLRVPSTDGRGAFQDPTHASFWNSNSFFYYSVDHQPYLSLCRTYGFVGAFKIEELREVREPDNVVHVQVRLRALKNAEAAPPGPSTGAQEADSHKYEELRRLQQAVQSEPASRQAWNNLARFCNAKALQHESAVFADIMASQRPNEAAVLLAAAGLNLAVKDFAAAQRYYEMVLKLDPANTEARHFLQRGSPAAGAPADAGAEPVMEDNLGMPLAHVLALIQRRMVKQSTYFGISALKSPTDFWVYQEIIWALKPDVIVEVGTAYGGGTLALAHLCDLIGKGRVISLDITHHAVPDAVKKHPRINLIAGDACQNFPQVRKLISEQDHVLVIEDSSHTYENTLNVLRIFGVLVKLGGYLIVEDSICHHGLATGLSPGPYEAVEAFVRENTAFEIDRSKESFFITWNPKGYLKRVQPG